MLEVIDVECTRGDRPLVRDMSFTLSGNELLHVAGSNGSGKTTLLRTLCGLSPPSAGEIRWDGADIRTLGDDYRALLAYVGHHNGIQGELTPAENLRTAACLAGCIEPAVIQHALERVGLMHFAHLPSKALSQGQKRRLALARLLVSKKILWVLDEPFAGLDAGSVAVTEDILADQLAGRRMIVITSHQELGRVTTTHRISLDS